MEDRDVLVSESGIQTRDDIQKLAEAGVRAVLVGETLMASADIGAAASRDRQTCIIARKCSAAPPRSASAAANPAERRE